MKAAVIGSGIAGLSLTLNFLKRGFSVDLYDYKGVGKGASGVSTGLLHAYPGRKALKSFRGEEAIDETFSLLDEVEVFSKKSLAKRTGIFRPAVQEHQKQDFSLRAKEDATVQWKILSPFGEGLWIEKGASLFSSSFLTHLWALCEKKGARLFLEKQENLLGLKGYDLILLAAGRETLSFAECKELPLQIIKGQALLCKWKEPFDFSLSSQGHISPTENPEICHVGSTYEHTFKNFEKDPSTALALLDKVSLFYPQAKEFEVVDIQAEARITRKGSYLPFIEEISPRIWAFTGFGSRGFLYAPLFAKEFSLKFSG